MSNRPHCANVADCKAKGAGHCRPCGAIATTATPGVREARRAAMLRHFADPAARAAHKERARATTDRLMTDPAYIARRREAGLRCGPTNLERTRTPEVRAKAAVAIRATKLAHVPEHLRDEYVRLGRSGWKKARRLKWIKEKVREEARELKAREKAERMADAAREGAIRRAERQRENEERLAARQRERDERLAAARLRQQEKAAAQSHLPSRDPAIASAALLRAMLRAGVGMGGLPGLDDATFRDRCRSMGVADAMRIAA